MKKKISLLLASLLIFSTLGGILAACTDNPPDSSETNPSLITNAPETNAPETNAPETNAPESNAPETNAPESNAPETNAPETNAPETNAPETNAPETNAPETNAPETNAPETNAPETNAPETNAPETNAPETNAPETNAPETNAPETNAPETNAPETEKEIEDAALIKYANSIKNGVNYYYPTARRETAVLTNLEMSIEYGLLQSGNKQVVALKNKAGAPYVENTMDVFIRMNDGSTYYASSSKTDTTSNLYRLGYYFYEARFEGQDFLNGGEITATKSIKLSSGISASNDITLVSNDTNGMTIKLASDGKGSFDPYISLKDGSHSTTKGSFTLLEITMKADAAISAGQVYVNTGAGFNKNQVYKFPLIADGNYHTYTIPLFLIQDYKGSLTGLRFDVDGTDGATYTFKEMKLHVADVSSLPAGLSIARSFNAYSDKMHHVIQVSAQQETTGIKEVGMLTTIRQETVAKLIVKDAAGAHDTLDGVDWATVEYVGFDIKNAGIFGYILPADNKSGTLNITLENGIYIIEQTCTPENGTIKPSEKETNNANDFFMGQRIYTDASHDFTEFLYEAACERTPITDKYFRINADSSANTAFAGYDALRGIYVLTYDENVSTGPNDYPTISFTVRTPDVDRKIYVVAYSDSSTVVETAVLLNKNKLMIPVPVEVGKNFSEAAGERNLYNIDDPTYSEAIFPLVLTQKITHRYSIVNAYFKWGRFPLKQVSWIQFYAPYYHLSTAMTETNCITPYYTTRTSRNLSVLPDFRAMSAPPFEGQQRNSGGTHNFLKYTDADGNFVTSENTVNTVGSHGPIYADVNMEYLTDDGKIKIKYNHMEMPQEDENRTYYEMSYEVLEDVSFKDFAKDFSFYSVKSNDPKGVYTLVGYLGEGNVNKVVDAKKAGDTAAYYTLGKDAPYFSYMKMTDDRANKSGYVNLAFLVHSSSYTRNGEEIDHSFKLADLGGTLSISLNFGEWTLKKGDKITINAILMPWGSQETIYDGSNGKAPDQNVRDVRQNSIKNPLRVEAVKDCEVIDSVYLPTLRTTNGKTAEFTVKGGQDNSAIRIYGFDLLTAPKVYELIEGNWVPYRLSSAYFSYNQAAVRLYDGYGVYYDEDGTFSYSFIVDKDNATDRTFKVEVTSTFGTWVEVDKEDIISNAEEDENINVIVRGEKLYNASESATGFSKIEYLEKENAVRYYADPNKTESYFYVFQSNIFETGDYFVMRYRTTKSPSTFKFYTSTFESGATYTNHHWSTGTIIRDGEWHVLVIDISEYEKVKEVKFSKEDPPRTYFNTFTPNEEDGKFYATFLRIDLFNQELSEGTYIDLQYLGFSNDLEKIKTYNNDLEKIQLSSTDAAKYEDILTGGGNGPSVDPDAPETGAPETNAPETNAPETNAPETNAPETNAPETNAPETNAPETEPEETMPEKTFTEMNLAVSGEALYNVTQTNKGAMVGMTTEYMNGFTRFHSDPTVTNGSFNVFNSNTTETGKYLVIKYRLPSNNPSRVSTLKFHVSTVSGAMSTSNMFYATAVFISDDNWHVLVVDLEKYEEQKETTNEFLPNSTDGKYYATFLKLFLFTDKNYADGTYIDIQYVAMCDEFNDVKKENTDMEKIQLTEANSGSAPFYVNKTNEYSKYLDVNSAYTPVDKYFCFHVDNINNVKYNYNSVSINGITETTLKETVGTKLTITGWSPLEGGTSKYLWSVDGKTWTQCSGTPGNNGDSILGAANGMMKNQYTFTKEDGIGGGLSSGITMDLSAYAGQTVNVIIAAVPQGCTNEICILTAINGVTVSAN